MKPQIIGIDPQTILGLANRTRGRDARGQSVFDSLLSQMAGQRQEAAVVGTGSSSSTASSSTSASADPLPASQTPLALLQQRLSDNGVSLERLQVPASDRSRLEEVLVGSGYKAEDAKQILDQSSNSDGSINLASVFNLLARYTPQQGPQFFIKADDKPLLSQVLKGLGIPSEDVNSFLDGLEPVGDRLRVTGLPALLAKAGSLSGEKSGQVDRSVLSDLLGKMGLSAEEVNSLLAKAYDTQGRANPKAVLALLQAAANRQDQAVAASLKDLSQRIKVAPQDQRKPLDADRLRAQFIKAVEEVESGLATNHADLAKDLTQALNALAKGQGEGKLNELLPRLMKTDLTGPSPEAGQPPAQAASLRASDAVASATAQAGLTGGGARQGGGGESQAQTPGRPAQADGSWGAALGRAGQSASAEQASGPRGALPAHVVRQVGQALTQMVARDQTTLRLELKPPSLGEINLELAVKDGAVSVKLVADSAAAKQALEAGMDQIKQDLANQGLKLERVEISVNPDAERGQAQAKADGDGGARREGFGSRAGGQGQAGLSTEDEAAVAADYLNRGSASRISVFA